MAHLEMTDADKTALGWYNQNIRGRYCQQCGALPTCRGRVDFGELNRCFMYADGYGRMDLARAEHAVLAGGRGADSAWTVRIAQPGASTVSSCRAGWRRPKRCSAERGVPRAAAVRMELEHETTGGSGK